MKRIQDQSGIGLVELLIAMTVTTVGIMALVAGFGSGIESIKRSSKTTTAGTLADRQMESMRKSAYSTLASVAPTTVQGADNRTYWIVTTVALTCPDESTPTGSPASCTISTPSPARQSRPLKRATVIVRDGSSTGKILISQTSTFDQSTG